MRRFELVEGTSSKFWEVEVRGSTVVVRFGRIGSDGQTKEKKLVSPSAAASELEKLVAEKVRKGYSEIGSAAKASKKPKAASTKAASKRKPEKKPPAIMAVPGLPGTEPGRFAFTTELDELFDRGWPHLRVLTDESIAPAAAQRKAIAALQAIDPLLPTIVPRDVARRMLLGYRFHPYDQLAKVKEAVASDAPITEKDLLVSIDAKFRFLGGPGETYEFRMADTLLFFEAFLGTETVVAAMVEHCARAMENPKNWGDAFHVDHDNANYRRVVPPLGWLRHRLPKAKWSKLVSPLRKGNPKLPNFSQTLRALSDDAAPLEGVRWALTFATQRRDRAAVREILEKQRWVCVDAQSSYVFGAEYLARCKVDELPRCPKWEQERIVAELGTIRAPGTVRVMAALLASRSVAQQAAAWLHQRADWVKKEALPFLRTRPEDAALVAAALGAIEGVSPPTHTPAQLRKEKERLFAELPARMKACNDDVAKEREAMSAAFARYCEINAALGDVIPEAYFTHSLDLDWDADEARVTRWIDTAVDVA